jgi:DNA-binding NarL/FixJ family response regulator
MGAPPDRLTVRVAVQSSRRLLRDALAACLSNWPDVTVVGKVAEPDDIPALCELDRPDVVILDAGPRLGEYAVLVGGLLRRFPELNVIATYRDVSEQDLVAACRAGVAALVPESHGLAAVLALLRRGTAWHLDSAQGGLTDRELELIVLTGSGHSVPEIAALLGISPFTVENLKRRVYAKLDVHSGAHAVSRAASLGMLGMLDGATGRARLRRAPPSADYPALTVVSGPACWALDQVVLTLVASRLPFVLDLAHGPVADSHWARWHRGPIMVALIDPGPPDWALVDELAAPAVVVHNKPLGPQDVAAALASGACALVAAGQIADHFPAVLRLVSHGYSVVDSAPMRSLIGAARARWDRQPPGHGELPELTARESDILQSAARGHSIRQTARVLGIAPKTVENVQTRLFRKLGVRNRSGALAVADAFGLLPESTPAAATDDPEYRARV